ncbi:hypothetical protein Tco_1353476 [Tanacetum coccineum]
MGGHEVVGWRIVPRWNLRCVVVGRVRKNSNPIDISLKAACGGMEACPTLVLQESLSGRDCGLGIGVVCASTRTNTVNGTPIRSRGVCDSAVNLSTSQTYPSSFSLSQLSESTISVADTFLDTRARGRGRRHFYNDTSRSVRQNCVAYPVDGRPRFAQLYIYDTANETENCFYALNHHLSNNSEDKTLNSLVQQLTSMLDSNNVLRIENRAKTGIIRLDLIKFNYYSKPRQSPKINSKLLM